MKLPDNEDAKTHLSELNQHFQLMLQRLDNLIQMGSTISNTRFNIIIMSSLPESYRPTLQTITAAERASTLSGGKASSMKPNNLIAFILEEAQHCVINDERTKNTEIALAAHSKKGKQSKSGKNEKSEKSHLKNVTIVADLAMEWMTVILKEEVKRQRLLGRKRQRSQRWQQQQ